MLHKIRWSAWFSPIALICALASTGFSLWLIRQHLLSFSQPVLQRKIIAILWMVPIYAIGSFISLEWISAAIYLDMLRDCYEAYVVYLFFALCIGYMAQIDQNTTDVRRVHDIFRAQGTVNWLPPLNLCYPPIKCTPQFLTTLKKGILQFVVVKPLTAFAAIICEMCGVYNEGSFDPGCAYLYLSFVRNISVSTALYCLGLFYMATRDGLKPYSPVLKFLSIKAILFVSFWQSVALAILVYLGYIKGEEVGVYTTHNVAAMIQNGVEMVGASLLFIRAFTATPYRYLAQTNSNSPRRNTLNSGFVLRNMFSLHDVLEDFNEVSPVVVPSSFRSYVVSSESRVVIPTHGAAELDRLGAPSAVTNAHAPIVAVNEHYPQESASSNPLAEPLNDKSGPGSQDRNERNVHNSEEKTVRTPSAPRGSSSGVFKTPPPRGHSRG